jgi:hypothetical protein
VPLEGRLPFERAVRIADELVAIAERDLTLARRAGDLRLDGEPLAILHFEGAEPIDPQLANLEAWYSPRTSNTSRVAWVSSTSRSAPTSTAASRRAA